MRTLTVVSVMLTLLTALAVTASAGSTVPSGWGYWDNGKFVLTKKNVEWATVWGNNESYSFTGMNNQISTTLLNPNYPNKKISWSGGEWYDIEGLYMDLWTDDGGAARLDWLLITSYPGLEAGEWTPPAPGSGWTGTQTGSGTITPEANGSPTNAWYRDHGQPQGYTGTWDYRSNPVIAINVGGDAAGYEWALVLDDSEKANANGQSGKPWDITTTAALYKVTDSAKWKNWIAPDQREFPAGVIADVDTQGMSPTATGTSVKNLALDHYESTDGTKYPQMTKDDGTISNGNYGVNYWPQYYNWYWTGSIDLTAAVASGAFTLPASSTPTSVHYAMWCANDVIDLKGTGYTANPDTPELPAGALVLLGMIPAGLAWWRRKGR